MGTFLRSLSKVWYDRSIWKYRNGVRGQCVTTRRCTQRLDKWKEIIGKWQMSHVSNVWPLQKCISDGKESWLCNQGKLWWIAGGWILHLLFLSNEWKNVQIFPYFNTINNSLICNSLAIISNISFLLADLFLIAPIMYPQCWFDCAVDE